MVDKYKNPKGFKRFSFVSAWEFLRNFSIITGTRSSEASQAADVGEKRKKAACKQAAEARKQEYSMVEQQRKEAERRERALDALSANALWVSAGNTQRQDIDLEGAVRTAAKNFCVDNDSKKEKDTENANESASAAAFNNDNDLEICDYKPQQQEDEQPQELQPGRQRKSRNLAIEIQDAEYS